MKYQQFKEHYWKIENKIKKIPYETLIKLFFVCILIVSIIQFFIYTSNVISIEISSYIKNRRKKEIYIAEQENIRKCPEELENLYQIHLRETKEFLALKEENNILKKRLKAK